MDIIIRNLSFSYGDTLILDNIELSAAGGEHIGIVGVSGGGKSTLLKLICGLYDIQSGVIALGGVTEPEARLRCTAVVMQNAMLFPASIRDNITCGHYMDDETVAAAIESACLSGWIAGLPEGLDTFVGERGSQVSGGQAQRIAIARAFAKDAPVILLDEPTSALDGGTGAAVSRAITNLSKGKTVIHVSHRPEALTGCGRIFKLESGKLCSMK